MSSPQSRQVVPSQISGYYAVRKGKGNLRQCIFVSWAKAQEFLDVDGEEVEFSFFSRIEDAIQYIHPGSTSSSDAKRSDTTVQDAGTKRKRPKEATENALPKKQKSTEEEDKDTPTRDTQDNKGNDQSNDVEMGEGESNNLATNDKDKVSSKESTQKGDSETTVTEEPFSKSTTDEQATTDASKDVTMKETKPEPPPPTQAPINVILAQGYQQNLPKGWRSQHLGLYLNRRDHLREPALKQYFQDIKELQKYLQFYSKPIRTTAEGKHISGASHPYCVFYLNWSWGVCNSYHRDIRRQQKKYMDQPYNQLEGIDLPLFKHVSKKGDKTTKGEVTTTKPTEMSAKEDTSTTTTEDESKSAAKDNKTDDAVEEKKTDENAKDDSVEGQPDSSDTQAAAKTSGDSADEKDKNTKGTSTSIADIDAGDTTAPKKPTPTTSAPKKSSPTATAPRKPSPLPEVKTEPPSKTLPEILEESYTNFRHRGWRARDTLPKTNNDDFLDDEEAEIHKTYIRKLKQKHYSNDLKRLEEFRETNPRKLERPLQNKGRCQHPSGIRSPFEVEYLRYAWGISEDEAKQFTKEAKAADQRSRQKRTLPMQSNTAKSAPDEPSTETSTETAEAEVVESKNEGKGMPSEFPSDDETPPLIEALRLSWFQGRDKGWRSADMGLSCGARSKALSVGARKKREEFYLQDLEVLKQWWKSYPSSQHYLFTVPDEGEDEETYKNMSYAATPTGRTGDQKRHKSGINAPWSLTYLNWSWGVSNSYNRDLVRKEKRKAQYRKAASMLKDEEKQVASNQTTLYI